MGGLLGPGLGLGAMSVASNGPFWDRIGKYAEMGKRFLMGGQAQAAPPVVPPGGATPMPLPTAAPAPQLAPGLSAPPSGGRTFTLPGQAQGGGSEVTPGWLSTPRGFTPQLRPQPTSMGDGFSSMTPLRSGESFLGAVPQGSMADLEGRVRAKQMLDQLYPEQTPEGRLQGLQMEALARQLTPLRPGEEPPRMMEEVLQSRRRSTLSQEMQGAVVDWQIRKNQAMEALATHFGVDLARDPEGLAMPDRGAAWQDQKQKLENAHNQLLQVIQLQYAPQLMPGLRGTIGQLNEPVY